MDEIDYSSEEWRPVVGYEAIYAVSGFGIVKRICNAKNNRVKKGYILRPWLVYGYPYVALERVRGFYVHRLVAFAFIGQRPDGYHINHKDGNKMNSHYSNLEYVTPKENQEHASRVGLLATGNRNGSRLHPEKVPRGEANGMAKLTNAQVDEIRSIHIPRKHGYGCTTLAIKYGVSKSTIARIVKRTSRLPFNSGG